MNAASCKQPGRWTPYVKAILFAFPALALWQAAYVFLFPKLEAIWAHGGEPASDAQGLMTAIAMLMRYASAVFLSIIAVLLILDFAAKGWARYRRAAVATAAFIFNAVVLFGFSAMCTAALAIAPALMQTK